MNPSAGFPMEQDRFPGKIWVVSHKPVAVAAGLGHMGIHRNVIHPRFGNFIILGTVLIDAEASELRPADRLQPVPGMQAVRGSVPGRGDLPGGRLQLRQLHDPQLPGVHERLRGLGGKGGRQQERPGLPQEGDGPETASMWQVAGLRTELQGGLLPGRLSGGRGRDRALLGEPGTFLKDTLRPLTDKEETIYVIAGSDAEEHVPRRFPAKTVKRVDSGIRRRKIEGFLFGLKSLFQAGKVGGLERCLPFHLHGEGIENGDHRDS